jgi:hypothetical protein
MELSSSGFLFFLLGFWITLVTLVLVLISGAIMFVNRRRELRANSGYPSISTQKKGVFSIFSRVK